MTISQPSKPIYSIDVPEVRDFTATFRYNFFTPDESSNETGGVPAAFLTRPASEVDAEFVQYSTTRAPRYVVFRWAKPDLADVGNELSELSRRNRSFSTTGEQRGSLIQDNLAKVVTEDDFASSGFASVHFHDGHIDDKIYEMVSGSVAAHMLTEPVDQNNSPYRLGQAFTATLPDHIKPHFVQKALASKAGGASYFLPPGSSAGYGPRTGALAAGSRTLYLDQFFESLKKVATNTQINTKFMHDLVNRSIRDPASTSADDLVNMHQHSKRAKQATNHRQQLVISEGDYRTYAPYFWVRRYGPNPHVQKYGAELVGFIIDKQETMANGSVRYHPSIVIDSPHVGMTADYQVKFNARYTYSVRSVALLTMPAIEEASGRVATVKVLVSSKPSPAAQVHTLKLDAPPPPGDVDFVWNYETNRLLVTWAFPVTSERDVKQFQVFRRRDIRHAFQLQKQYDFDDSTVKFPYNELPDPRLVERLSSPATSWYDDEFNWDVNTTPKAGLIYAVAAIDAHGQTSGYSAQYRVWFDRFKNSLQKELVSHLGAPKPYPNLYVEGTLFENSIRVAGHKRMRLYFNPDFYYYTDDHDRLHRAVETAQVGGGYKLQFINLDNMKSADINITINDMTTHAPKQAVHLNVRPGLQRKPLPRIV